MPRLYAVLAIASLATSSPGCVTVTTTEGEVVSKQESYSDSRLKTLDDEAKLYPKRHDLHYEIAQIHFQQGDFHESAASLSRAISLAPDVSRYHYDLGRVYLRSADFAKAEGAFREATRLSGDRYSGPRAALGYVLAMEKKFDEALHMFEKCVELEPENPEYYYYLGSIYDMTGQTAGAVKNFREYLDRGGKTYRRKVVFLLERLGVEVDPEVIAETEPPADQLPVPGGEADFGPVSRAPLPEPR